jgi:hypothetical protein
MRKYKSRTKRGGTFSGFQSDLLTDFKFAVRRGITKPSYVMFDQDPTAGVTEDVKHQIAEDLKKYNSLTDRTLQNFVINQHSGLVGCNDTKVKLLKDQINVESPKRRAYYLYVLGEICKIATGQAAQPDSQVPPPTDAAAPAAATAAASAQPAKQQPKANDTVYGPAAPEYKGTGFGPIKRKHANPIEGIEALESAVTITGTEGVVAPRPPPVYDPRISSGGKSRRRHRRVKFGKSKKGRTTRRLMRKHRR